MTQIFGNSPVVYVLNQLWSQLCMMTPEVCLCEALNAWLTADLYTNSSGSVVAFFILCL